MTTGVLGLVHIYKRQPAVSMLVLKIEGDFEIVDRNGDAYGLQGRTVLSICRCGLSKNKPLGAADLATENVKKATEARLSKTAKAK